MPSITLPHIPNSQLFPRPPFPVLTAVNRVLDNGFKRLSTVEGHKLDQIKLVYITPQDTTDVVFVTNCNEVYVFGTNKCGRLGIGHDLPLEEPTLIPELCGKDVVKIISATYSMAALTSTGEVWTWGAGTCVFGFRKTKPNMVWSQSALDPIRDIECTNAYLHLLCQSGRVFRLDIYRPDFHQLLPQHVPGLNEHQITSIACGTDHTLVLSSCGKVLVWGLNSEGQLGLGTIDNRSSSMPQTITLDVCIKQIACGANHSLLLATNGKILSFGANNHGQLGIGTNSVQTIPQFVKKAVEFIEISAFGCTSMALSKSNKIYIWGSVGNKSYYWPKYTGNTSFQMTINHFEHNIFTLKSIPYRQLIEKKRSNGLSQVMARAFNNPLHSDLKFTFKKKGTEDQFDCVYAHKWFLSGHSEYFTKLFAENNSQEFEIIDNSYEAYYHFVRYLYTEEVETQDIEVLKEILIISNTLLDAEKKRKFVEPIQRLVANNNVCSIYSIAREYDYEDLEEYCFDFMSRNITSIINTDDYERLADNHSKYFFTNYIKLGVS